MGKVDFREVWPDLLCLNPCYGRDGSNGTQVLLASRPPLYSSLRTKTLVRQLARHFAVDLKAACSKYSAICGRSYALPLPLRPGLILVPVRSRQARFKDDGTRAYVVKSKICALAPLTCQEPQGGGGRSSGGAEAGSRRQGGGSRLLFLDGSHLDVPHSLASLRSLLALAGVIEREEEQLAAGSSVPRVMDPPCNCPYGCCGLRGCGRQPERNGEP